MNILVVGNAHHADLPFYLGRNADEVRQNLRIVGARIDHRPMYREA